MNAGHALYQLVASNNRFGVYLCIYKGRQYMLFGADPANWLILHKMYPNIEPACGKICVEIISSEY